MEQLSMGTIIKQPTNPWIGTGGETLLRTQGFLLKTQEHRVLLKTPRETQEDDRVEGGVVVDAVVVDGVAEDVAVVNAAI